MQVVDVIALVVQFFFLPLLLTFALFLATPMMSPAATQDSMGYGYDPQQTYDGSMGYEHGMHQDLSP